MDRGPLRVLATAAVFSCASIAVAQGRLAPTVIKHRFPLQGLDVIETRTVDPLTGLVHASARTRDGRRVEVDVLLRREIAQRRLALGKMSADLNRRVADAATGDRLDVAFWLDVPTMPDFRMVLERARRDGHGPEEARLVAFDAARRFLGPVTEAFAAAVASRGHRVLHEGGAWPVVIASVEARDVASIAADPRVNTAYHASDRWETENDYAQPTLRTPTVHDRGITGRNSTLRVMVHDPGHVTTVNPYLPPVTRLNGGNAASHATSVAGNICSQHPQWFGGAKELPILYSANGTGDTNAPPAWTLAIQNGVSYGNCSWWNGKKGRIEFLDRFFDYTIRQFGVMMFKSTGNQGNSSSPFTTTPGNGYNVTNSGAYSDRDTLTWDDDQMASYSSYADPAEGHEKPELASPGDGVRTTSTSSPWTRSGFGGTSSASPLTCGVATLLGTRDPNLRTRTYTLKAVLMASAWHNIEGDDVLSEYDGAGGVHAAAADSAVRDGQYVDGTLTASSFPGGFRDERITVDAGDETRVVVLWQSNANSSYTTDTLDMDLDVTILDPSNQVVASSANAFNAFEIVKFTPTVSGTYTVRMTRQKFNGANEPYAVAWSTRQDLATADITLSGSGGIGTTMNVIFRDRYHPGAAYRGAAAVASAYTTSIGGGHVVPLNADSLFWASLLGAFPGFAGTLNGQGEAQGQIAIPADGALRGIGIDLAVVSFTQSGTIRGVSERANFTIR